MAVTQQQDNGGEEDGEDEDGEERCGEPGPDGKREPSVGEAGASAARDCDDRIDCAQSRADAEDSKREESQRSMPRP